MLYRLELSVQFNPENNNMTKAIYWYKKVAENGHPLALRILSYCYLKGFGVNKDYRTAQALIGQSKNFWEKAQDNDMSVKLLEQMVNDKQNQFNHSIYHLQYLMRDCFSDGLGVVECQKTAFNWFRTAAYQG